MNQERIQDTTEKARNTSDTYQAPDIDATLSRATSAVSKVRVVHGANENYYELQGKTVGSVRKSLREVHNIPGDAEAFVQGQKVNDDFVLTGGSTLEFSKTAGIKG